MVPSCRAMPFGWSLACARRRAYWQMPLMQRSDEKQQSLSTAQPVSFVSTQPQRPSPSAQTPVQHCESAEQLARSGVQLPTPQKPSEAQKFEQQSESKLHATLSGNAHVLSLQSTSGETQLLLTVTLHAVDETPRTTAALKIRPTTTFFAGEVVEVCMGSLSSLGMCRPLPPRTTSFDDDPSNSIHTVNQTLGARFD